MKKTLPIWLKTGYGGNKNTSLFELKKRKMSLRFSAYLPLSYKCISHKCISYKYIRRD